MVPCAMRYMSSARRRFRIFAWSRLLRLLYRRRSPWALERLGSRYGGWFCAPALLSEGATAVCCGAGEDISFDVALNSRFAMHVLCVDPTPRAIVHVEKILAQSELRNVQAGPAPVEQHGTNGIRPERFKLVKAAVWSVDGALRLWEPADVADVSYSALNLQCTQRYIEVLGRTLGSILHEHELSDVAVLKLDIEGAEYEVVRNMVEAGIRPRQLLVEFDEFHHPASLGALIRVIRTVGLLNQVGYQLASVDRANCTFIHQKKTNSAPDSAVMPARDCAR